MTDPTPIDGTIREVTLPILSCAPNETQSTEPGRDASLPAPGPATEAHEIVLSVIVPTYCERDNAEEVVRRLRACLEGEAWEVVFVDDDSPDETVRVIRDLAARDPRVRCLHRVGRSGLASACVEGMLSSSAPYLAVMDADLQHDETLLRPMLDSLRREHLDIVVGSRYADGGSIGEWDGRRALISRVADRLSRPLVPADLRDPMSGFFMIRRDTFLECVRQLSAIGFKLLVDLFASSTRPLRFKELPYVFRNRRAGESKLDNRVAWDYAMLLLDKLIGHLVPVRFASFALIGGFGVLVHLLVLSAIYRNGIGDFITGQVVATAVAMVSNFAINNSITYRDRRLTGWRWIRGLLSFVVLCGVGAVANVGIAHYAFERESGWILAALAGILVGAVWNYAVTSVYTWGGGRR